MNPYQPLLTFHEANLKTTTPDKPYRFLMMVGEETGYRIGTPSWPRPIEELNNIMNPVGSNPREVFFTDSAVVMNGLTNHNPISIGAEVAMAVNYTVIIAEYEYGGSTTRTIVVGFPLSPPLRVQPWDVVRQEPGSLLLDVGLRAANQT